MSDEETQKTTTPVEPEVLAPVQDGESAKEAAEVPEADSTAPIVEEAPVEEVIYVYHGKKVVEKLDQVNGEGRLCKLEDGTTSFVPLSILGE